MSNKKETTKLVCCCGAVYERTEYETEEFVSPDMVMQQWISMHEDCLKYHNLGVFKRATRPPADIPQMPDYEPGMTRLTYGPSVEELIEQHEDKSGRLLKIHKMLVCVGGALNDNKLRYNSKQLKELMQIDKIAVG